jgi:hypothetical protein
LYAYASLLFSFLRFFVLLHFFFFSRARTHAKKKKRERERMSATAQQKDFTHLSAQSVQTIAEAFGIVISDDVAKALAPDVEYRLRDIIQEALKVTKRSRRTVLTTEVFDLQICFTSSVCLFVCVCIIFALPFHRL